MHSQSHTQAEEWFFSCNTQNGSNKCNLICKIAMLPQSSYPSYKSTCIYVLQRFPAPFGSFPNIFGCGAGQLRQNPNICVSISMLSSSVMKYAVKYIWRFISLPSTVFFPASKQLKAFILLASRMLPLKQLIFLILKKGKFKNNFPSVQETVTNTS